jgi:hypothetical protein
VPNAAALGLDLYSYPSQKNEIDLAVSTREAVLGGRLKVVQEVDDNAYSILIYHPGIYLETSPDDHADVLGVILVRVPSLLARTAAIQEESLACYIYDTTVFNTGGSTDFLGAVDYDVTRHPNGTIHTDLTFHQEVEIENVRDDYSSDYFYEEDIPIAHGTWKIVVVPIDDRFEPNTAFVIFGGVMILISSIGLTTFLFYNSRSVFRIHEAKAAAEMERNIVSSLFPEKVITRLLEDAETKKAAMKEKKLRRKLKRSPGSVTESSSNEDKLTSEGLFGSKPIAEFHPQATIM